MTFQSTVNAFPAAGFIGELARGAPWRAQPGVIDSVGTTNPNAVGYAFTATVGVDGHCGVGGTIGEGTPFYGILANAKEYALGGTTAGGPLASTLALAQYKVGDFVYNTTGMYVNFEVAGNVGDFVDFDTTTGKLYPRAGFGTTGVGTLAITSNVGTVASLPAGSPLIGVGSVFQTVGGPATVLAILTGTGGNGTYTLSPIANQSATAATLYSTVAPSGRNQIPGGRVAFNNIAAAGLGILSINE